MYGPPTTGPDPGLEQLIQPQQQPMPQAPGTLGDVNQQMAGNPYIEQFLQLRQGLGQMTDPLKLPLEPPQPGPSLLESLGTFGIANLRHIANENTRREENYRRFVQNRAVDMQANQMAMHLLNGQAQAAALAGRANIATQRLQLDMLGIQQRLDEAAQRRAQDEITRELKMNTRPAPKTPEEAQYLRLAGWGESEDPAVWRKVGRGGAGTTSTTLAPKPGGGWDLPANAPMAKALGDVDAGAGAQAANAPLPGEQPEDTASRLASQQRIKEKTAVAQATERAKTGPYAQAALNDLKNLREAVKLAFPPGQSPAVAKMAGIPRSYGAAKAQTPTQQALLNVKTIRSRLMSYIRGMGSSSRMPQGLIETLMSGMPDLSSNREHNLFLIDQMENQIKQYATDYPETGQGVNLPGPTEAAAGAPTAPTGPTGSTPGSLDELLKKHNR